MRYEFYSSTVLLKNKQVHLYILSFFILLLNSVKQFSITKRSAKHQYKVWLAQLQCPFHISARRVNPLSILFYTCVYVRYLFLNVKGLDVPGDTSSDVQSLWAGLAANPVKSLRTQGLIFLVAISWVVRRDRNNFVF